MKVGILGAGQLGRMLALAGYPLGLRFRVLDPAPDSCAAPLTEPICADYSDMQALARFVEGLDVVTFEFENVPAACADFLTAHCAVYPPPAALAISQDRVDEKHFFAGCGIATAPFEAVDSLHDLRSAANRLGLPAILKTRRLGYDGKGQRLLRTVADLVPAWEALGSVPLVLEGFVPFERELSILGVRGRTGEARFYPVTQNRHVEGILRLSVAPAPDLSAALQVEAESICLRAMERLNYVGVLAIELFEEAGGLRANEMEPRDTAGNASANNTLTLRANEMAPRVHNSGHWTMDGAVTSQFENHLRAVCGLPLGDTAALGYCAMVNLIGTPPDLTALLGIPQARVHLYGKAPRPGRKVGHVNLRADSEAELLTLIAQVQSVLAGG